MASCVNINRNEMQILESKSLVHSYSKELKEEALKVASSNICSRFDPTWRSSPPSSQVAGLKSGLNVDLTFRTKVHLTFRWSVPFESIGFTFHVQVESRMSQHYQVS